VSGEVICMKLAGWILGGWTLVTMNHVVVKEKVDIGNKLSFLSTKKCGKKNAKKLLVLD